MSIELKRSKDGSFTLFHSQLNETYHSLDGAISESKYVYLKQGVELISKESIRVLEVGMGTGLNILLLYHWAHTLNKTIEIHTIEPFPLKEEIINQLNYIDAKDQLSKTFFQWLHTSDWNVLNNFNEHFIVKKYNTTLLNTSLPNCYFDCCFYDAFAPSKQPKMWTVECFEKIYNSLLMNGFLTTYCAQGAFKRTIKSIEGFELKVLPGPLYKKEMIHAIRFK
jgi:tRNA U34 5-methylaminomethyl-2-thiouridine-forming methyltransferase MnmC